LDRISQPTQGTSFSLTTREGVYDITVQYSAGPVYVTRDTTARVLRVQRIGIQDYGPDSRPPKRGAAEIWEALFAVLPLTRRIIGTEQTFTHLEIQCIHAEALKESLRMRFGFRDMPFACGNLVWGA
jgi:hypothetical protein